MGAFDKVLADKVHRHHSREKREETRRNKMKQEMIAATATVTSTNIADEHDTGDSSTDAEDFDIGTVSTKTAPHHGENSGTSAHIPRDILEASKIGCSSNTFEDDTSSPAQQAAYTEALIAESGGDASAVSSSYATADRCRRNTGSSIAESIKQQWVVPKFLTLHWDSKLIPTLSNPNTHEERLTVVVGDTRKLKLLGVPTCIQVWL